MTAESCLGSESCYGCGSEDREPFSGEALMIVVWVMGTL